MQFSKVKGNMAVSIFESDFFKKKARNRSSSPESESNYTEISLSSGFSHSDVSFLSCSSIKTQIPFHSFDPVPTVRPRGPQRPFHNFHPGPTVRPQKLPSYHPNNNFRSNLVHGRSSSIPHLVTVPKNPSNDSPGPSYDNCGPSRKKKLKMVQQRGIEMSVRHASPQCKLTENQGMFIQSQLLEALDKNPKKIQSPRFLRSLFDEGVFWIICGDEFTHDWLIRKVRKLNYLYKDLKLVVEQAEFPKSHIVYVDIPGLQKSIEVLDRISYQNKDLRTDSWVVLDREMFKSRQRLTILIDKHSFEFLKSIDFTVTWKLQTLVFKVPAKGNRRRAGKLFGEHRGSTSTFQY